MREPCPNQSISLRILHRCLLHPGRSLTAARLAPPPPLPYPFLPILSASRRCTGKAMGAVLGVFLAVPEVDARRATPRNTSCSASSNVRSVPAPRKSAAASLLCSRLWEAHVAWRPMAVVSAQAPQLFQGPSPGLWPSWRWQGQPP